MTERMWAEAERRRELREQEQQFLAEQEQRREQRERERKQAEMEQHLRARAERYQDATGEVPSLGLLKTWQDAWEEGKEQERAAETQRQIALKGGVAGYGPY